MSILNAKKEPKPALDWAVSEISSDREFEVWKVRVFDNLIDLRVSRARVGLDYWVGEVCLPGRTPCVVGAETRLTAMVAIENKFVEWAGGYLDPIKSKQQVVLR